jgi:hypothetical protein
MENKPPVIDPKKPTPQTTGAKKTGLEDKPSEENLTKKKEDVIEEPKRY